VRSSSRVQNSLQRAIDVSHQLVVRGRGRRWQGTNDSQTAGRKIRESRGHHSAQAAVDAVPQNRIAHRLVHHESDTSRLDLWVGLHQEMDHHGTPTGAPSGADDAAEVVGPTEPVRRRQHEVVTVTSGVGRTAQAARR
jgi:hypothetical protein